MAIVALPDDIRTDEITACAICGEKKPLHALTAGVLTPDGHQAFGCETHRQERSVWTLGWLMLPYQLPFSALEQTPTRILRV